MTQRKHIFYYDLIKLMAAYMVCFYHLGMLDFGNVSDTFYIPNINRILVNLCAMSVPLFFMVNGALMLRRTYSWKEAVLRSVKLLFLYYFWVVMIGEIGEFCFQIEQVPYMEILGGTRNSITVHLWFFKTIARLAILTPIFKKIYDSSSKICLYGIIIGLFVCPFLYNYGILFVNWFDIEPLSVLPVTGVDTMYSVLYFFIGKMIADRSEAENGSEKGRKCLAVLCALTGWILTTIEGTLWTNLDGVVYDGVNSSFPTIGALLMAVGIFYLCSKVDLQLKGYVKKIFQLCAENVMGVYIFHPILVQILNRMIGHTVNLGIKCLMTAGIVLLLSLFTKMIKKIPLLRNVVLV